MMSLKGELIANDVIPDLFRIEEGNIIDIKHGFLGLGDIFVEDFVDLGYQFIYLQIIECLDHQQIILGLLVEKVQGVVTGFKVKNFII